MEESREERRLKQEKKFAIRDFKEVIKTGNIFEKIGIILFTILFFVFYPIEWLMANENTKKCRIINLTIQVAVSILTTIITLNYLKK
ncbi:hypothetical protein [Parvimonas sp. G1967]|uniref:hypothetical protein n=1 Tax=Parvimonas sp. G1967 TaxID=3387695 RepID=UPI0039E6C278